MTSQPSVTLLLPNRNNAHVLDLMFERLLEHTTYPDFEVVAVDDGSTDDSLAILRRWRDSAAFPSFTLLEREHGGVVLALNAGLAAAGGELVVQLDGDATVETAGWLQRMVDFYASDDSIGIVTPMVTLDSGYIHAAGVNMICREGLHDRGTTPMEDSGARTVHTLVTRLHRREAIDLAAKAQEVDSAIGVCMLYAREMAESLGGYDSGFSPVWFDDLDLALSARRLGLKAFFVPGVEVVHRMSLRGDRTVRSTSGDLRRRARKAVSRATPAPVRNRVVNLERRNTAHPPHELRRLRHHYAYWREKWGFDLLNPDLDAILKRYGQTEICWRYEAQRREAGERLAAAWPGPASESTSS